MSTVRENSPFYLTMGKMSESAIADLSDHFNHLPDNTYQDGGYRLRRFSVFHYRDGQVEKLPHRSFLQSSEFNKFQGDVDRDYEDIVPECYQSAGFAEMMAHYVETSGLPDGVDIEMHQLRIQAKPGEISEVAPEGVHQDGYNRIGMFLINYENISGGELKIHLEKTAPVMTEYLPQCGEYIILNDAKFWHDANAIVNTSETELGYYDLFVLTGTKPE